VEHIQLSSNNELLKTAFPKLYSGYGGMSKLEWMAGMALAGRCEPGDAVRLAIATLEKVQKAEAEIEKKARDQRKKKTGKLSFE
jgi:hypothetical protein